jgi:hypothetical protein
VNPNPTWGISLESYHAYVQPQKVSKNPQTYCVHNTLSKRAKSHFGYLCRLGANWLCILVYLILVGIKIGKSLGEWNI